MASTDLAAGRYPARYPGQFSGPAIWAERPETWVTFRTGHMGDTFRFRAGGVDAVESGFGNGRAPSFRRSAPGWRADDPDVSGVRHLAHGQPQGLQLVQCPSVPLP